MRDGKIESTFSDGTNGAGNDEPIMSGNLRTTQTPVREGLIQVLPGGTDDTDAASTNLGNRCEDE